MSYFPIAVPKLLKLHLKLTTLNRQSFFGFTVRKIKSSSSKSVYGLLVLIKKSDFAQLLFFNMHSYNLFVLCI